MDKKKLLSFMPFFLLFIAGTVDVIGFLHLQNGLFVSFMSGNTTHVGILLNEPIDSRVWYYAGVICLFILGALFGEVIALSAAPYYRCIIMLFVVLLLSFTVLITHITPPIVTNLLLSFAMGIQNIALRVTIKQAIPLTFATGFLVNTGRSLALLIMRKSESSDLKHSFLLWASIFLGGVTGAKAMSMPLDFALMLPIILSTVSVFMLYWTHEIPDV
ncbi:YoaK family protein [Vibrio sagamiensis]|uniref:DUF1275 family protein n=1 Tax=Vibrio sagamiensis NBRC 104589 TaxID=1219064 RepID=A0A511QFV3_9VIBR|nr:YoaK family protein [Vibrio sagamiensis]PNQ54259.1 DUF1275 domain-containing protein [Vibrio agarivorans]GEM76193.1 hypothetical protein VSA01S_23050 [Vibrio sagamiensis NBRC 104589]